MSKENDYRLDSIHRDFVQTNELIEFHVPPSSARNKLLSSVKSMYDNSCHANYALLEAIGRNKRASDLRLKSLTENIGKLKKDGKDEKTKESRKSLVFGIFLGFVISALI
ncbi:hypothetical protein EDB29_1011092 [Vibrio crassostreae]|uniref:hypothetical protein n=1 Tax=Vibrio crassostreae TaxID=246167 RepID=UPI001051EBE5|nr:hypothetical protein [Vibrio crassostreae]CAH6851628.1 hypothetical protein VCHA34P121_10504 [Vibrio chagasii]TCT44280.1 hypothetical protein EDB29_1011092 [Vibrio crassostreae]CAH6863304.1 hypothetical protein VCHA28FP16_10843 [Vibrio chagasii]CAH6929420.1 hypothetical protein VCHA48P437_100159 [Vibrio chagasii]CAH6948952.1 hypothetical protein VCHA44O286_110159 [Vibrio chagasii]